MKGKEFTAGDMDICLSNVLDNHELYSQFSIFGQLLEKYRVSIFTFEKRISPVHYCALANRRSLSRARDEIGRSRY